MVLGSRKLALEHILYVETT